MQKKKTYNLFVLIAFAALAFPMLIGFTIKNKNPNLIGIVINNVNPDSLLTSEQWFSGEYQSLKDDYNNDHWAFKESFVRLNNQLYYDVFNQIRVNKFVSGKEKYVFAEVAIQSYYGDDFMGDENVNQFLHKCKVVQDTLSKKGINLILVYAPGKGIGASKYIDDKYNKPVKETNIKAFAAQSKKLDLNYLDLVDYFNQIKDTCKYPLYAQFAHHWTSYFDCLASKKIIKYIEDIRKADLPDLTWTEAAISDTARNRDNDVLKSMNLYKNPVQKQLLAYPKFQIESDSLKNTTRVLTVADSYWYGIVYMGVPEYCLGGGQFWYYYNRIIPNPSPTEKIEVWQLDLKESIESNNVIMILGSDPALSKFGWGFIEDAYEMYTDPLKYNLRMEKMRILKQFEKQIREKPLLLKKATKKSFDRQIPLDSAIKLDAMKLAGIK